PLACADKVLWRTACKLPSNSSPAPTAWAPTVMTGTCGAWAMTVVLPSNRPNTKAHEAVGDLRREVENFLTDMTGSYTVTSISIYPWGYKLVSLLSLFRRCGKCLLVPVDGLLGGVAFLLGV